MLERLFPSTFDNQYRGYRLALWLFILITFVNTGISLVAILRPDGGAQSADGIPLSSYSPAAAQAVIGVIAFLGLSNLVLCMINVLALFRYRSMIPLLYAFAAIIFLGHKWIGAMKPIVRVASASPSGFVNLSLFAITLLGLALSLMGARYDMRSEAPAGLVDAA